MIPSPLPSPYAGAPISTWVSITEQLIRNYPLTPQSLVAAVLAAWEQIFESRIGPLRIGVDIFPQPQITGFFLHELIPVVIAETHPDWRIGNVGALEKDLHYNPDPLYSTEIKTSSSLNQIFANRSYAQPATPGSRGKDGYYLAVNFQPFSSLGPARPDLGRIRLGWLDHSDWVPQRAATGQQARLRPEAHSLKLKTLYP